MSSATLVFRSSIAGSAWHAAQTATTQGRDFLARRLIARAWNRTLAAGVAVKPWPWADLFPVARLEAPSHRAISIVLAGARARALRFGPGHFEGTPLPGESGNAVISGHCRTHFAFLRDLRSGDPLCVHAERCGGTLCRLRHRSRA